MKRLYIILVIVGCVSMAACRKTDYPVVSSPAYLRVFNCLTNNITIDNKDAPGPYLTMLIDPVTDASGAPTDAKVTFDYLGTRGQLARPYPDAGNTALWQTEFPGSAKIAVGPIVNGFDLSGYGQVTSGTHRFVFVTRPFSDDPFYSLKPDTRKNVILDTTFTLQQGEIYTMNILQQSVYTQKAVAQVRNEQFTKIPFSDSMVYVNFYNESAEGYFATNVIAMQGSNTCIRDTMGVYLSLYDPYVQYGQAVHGFSRAYMYNMIRSQDSAIHPYSAFPLFPDTIANHIYAGQMGQTFTLLSPGTPTDVSYSSNSPTFGIYSAIGVGPIGDAGVWHIPGDVNTGMVITTRSGIYNPRSFATVNTIEVINGQAYLTTLQRRYDPPVY